MAMINLGNSGIGISNISAINGYDPYRDTIFGIPTHEWHRLSPSDQRYYSEREYMRQQHMKAGLPLELQEKRTLLPSTPLEPTFLTNTKLLLTGVES